MNSRWLAASGCLVAALAMGAAACGGDDDEGGGGGEGGGGAKTVKVYSSLPLQGASRPQTTALVNGVKLALEQAGGKAGDITVQYESLDDSTAQAGSWTPEATTSNARKAAQDEATAVYIGEFNSGASAVSIPILNEAGVPQISPANTAVGLTSDEPGADAGEPDKYYPTGQRNYVRIVPKDTIQAAALVTLMKEDGCTKVQLTNDKEVYGAGLARNIEIAAEEQGLELIGNDAIDKNAANYRSLAQKAKGAGADCFVYSGITANNAVQLYKDFEAASAGREAVRAGRRCRVRVRRPQGGWHPGRRGVQVAGVRRDPVPGRVPAGGPGVLHPVREEVRRAQPGSVLDLRLRGDAPGAGRDRALRRGNKEDIVPALFETKDRPSVLGTYSIDENGDTTLTDYGIYKIEGGELTFDKTVKAQAGG